MNLLKTFIFSFFLLSVSFLNAQIELPSDKVKWSFELEQKGAEATVIVNVKCEEHWHINAVKLPKGSFGFPTSLKLDRSKDFALSGGVIEPKPTEKYDDLADEQLSYHEGSFKLKQKIKITSAKDFFVQGTFSFQTCNEVKCLPDFSAPFKLKVKGVEGTDAEVGKDTTSAVQPGLQDSVKEEESKVESKPIESVKKEEKQQSQSYGLVFLLAFLSGFAALIMPCVFPMIPMTVSFFTKRSKTRAEGIKNAMIYGTSIVVIHFLLGLLVVVTGSSSLLNEMSTNVWYNNCV